VDEPAAATAMPDEGWRKEFAEAFAAFRTAHPDVRTIEVFCLDLNGIAHGKRVPLSAIQRIAEGGTMAFQTSLAGLDVFCHDVPESAIAMEVGDPDGVFVPLAHTLKVAPWSDRPLGLLQGMVAPRGSDRPLPYDPRGVLLRVLDRARRHGFTPIMALELEFYLIDPAETAPPRDPRTGQRLSGEQILDLDVMQAFDPVIDAVTDAAAALGIETGATLCEFGPGQFEINLGHAEAARACDEMVALRRTIRAVARRKGLDATFMAKPFDGASGSGLHVHLSLERDGANAFDEPGEPIGPTLAGAVGGLVETMGEAFLLFAPHLNSYRRHLPGSYAPVGGNWGIDNRGAAVRIPETRGPGARLEHRVAGADANPYLGAAAVIAGAVHGIGKGLAPPPPSTSEADGTAPGFPADWTQARERFASSAFVADWMDPEFRRILDAVKRQEQATFRARVTDVERAVYLRKI
jgi:glutamine synthetase